MTTDSVSFLLVNVFGPAHVSFKRNVNIVWDDYSPPAKFALYR
jgi:hypothetical protein